MRAGITSSAARPIWSSPEVWTTAADIFVVLIALALPWSTSLVAIFAVMWLLTVVPTLDSKFFLQIPKRPICVLPIALSCSGGCRDLLVRRAVGYAALCDQSNHKAARASASILSF